jgi:hypothetical protein
MFNGCCQAPVRLHLNELWGHPPTLGCLITRYKLSAINLSEYVSIEVGNLLRACVHAWVLQARKDWSTSLPHGHSMMP